MATTTNLRGSTSGARAGRRARAGWAEVLRRAVIATVVAAVLLGSVALIAARLPGSYGTGIESGLFTRSGRLDRLNGGRGGGGGGARAAGAAVHPHDHDPGAGHRGEPSGGGGAGRPSGAASYSAPSIRRRLPIGLGRTTRAGVSGFGERTWNPCGGVTNIVSTN
jgi:hypothetical protein